jgi:hypothetical protein
VTGSVHMGFVVGKAALGQVFPLSLATVRRHDRHLADMSKNKGLSSRSDNFYCLNIYIYIYIYIYKGKKKVKQSRYTP